MYQATKHFKKLLNYCPAEKCLTFCAPLMKSEIMVLLCILNLPALSCLNLQHSLFFAVEVILQACLSSLQFSFSCFYIALCIKRT